MRLRAPFVAAAAKCGTPYTVYYDHTYSGTDRVVMKPGLSTDVLNHPTVKDAKERAAAPLHVRIKFYRDAQGSPWADVFYTPGPGSPLSAHANKVGYNLRANGDPVQVSLNPTYKPSITYNGEVLDPGSKGWDAAVASQAKGYTITYHRHYNLNATDCTKASSLPGKLSQRTTLTLRPLDRPTASGGLLPAVDYAEEIVNLKRLN